MEVPMSDLTKAILADKESRDRLIEQLSIHPRENNAKYCDMDFRMIHVIIGELEFDNIKLAAKGDKQALNILALTKSFIELEHKYRKQSESACPSPSNAKCDTSDDSKSIDWKALRNKYFRQCVNNGGYVMSSKIDMAPHDLFEWFKKELAKYVY